MDQIVVGVSGVALDASKNLLLVRRGHPPYAGTWSLPGGRINRLEPHRRALAREFREETGLEISVGEPAGIAEAISPEQGTHYVILTYFVKVTGGKLHPGDDASEVRWTSREDLNGLSLTPGLQNYLEMFGVWAPEQSGYPTAGQRGSNP